MQLDGFVADSLHWPQTAFWDSFWQVPFDTTWTKEDYRSVLALVLGRSDPQSGRKPSADQQE
jgi:hypothetical protein